MIKDNINSNLHKIGFFTKRFDRGKWLKTIFLLFHFIKKREVSMKCCPLRNFHLSQYFLGCHELYMSLLLKRDQTPTA